MTITIEEHSNKKLHPGLDSEENYKWTSDDLYEGPTSMQISCDYPDAFLVETDVDNVVQGYVDFVIENQCIDYLRDLWLSADVKKHEFTEKKLKLHKVPHEKISWPALWNFGLRAVKFHFREVAENDGKYVERERAQKNAQITADDVLREIEKHLMKLIKKDFIIKVTEKDLCKMAHMHEHAEAKDKDPAMQRALTDAAELAHRNYASACGGKWGYVSARWQQSDAQGDVLRLQFERYDGKIVELTAEEMHFHWRSCDAATKDVFSHPLYGLANAWLNHLHFA